MARIYHLIKSLGRGGAEMLLTENLRFSNADRFEYAYGYFLPWKNALEPALEARGSSVECFECRNTFSILWAARRVAARLREWNADLVHCHLPIAGVVGRMAGRMAGIPVVYTEHNRLERYHPLTRRANLMTWKMQNMVIAVSEEVSTSIQAHTDRATPVRVILNGVDTDRFRPDQVDRSSVRRDLGIPPTAPVIGSVAVFRTQKRLQDWLTAARLLLNDQPDLHFVLVGDGPVREELVRQSHASGLDGALHFPGLQEDVRPYLAAMNVFMISSQFEGLPVALLEAMAMECGIVSTAVGGIPEVIRSGENGLLVEPFDPRALARAADELLQAVPLDRDERDLGSGEEATDQDQDEHEADVVVLCTGFQAQRLLHPSEVQAGLVGFAVLGLGCPGAPSALAGTASRAAPVRAAPDNRASSMWLKLCSMRIPKTAIASKPAVRETALLIPEATPTRFSGTEFITVVVRGATLTAIPMPRTRIAGKNVAQ